MNQPENIERSALRTSPQPLRVAGQSAAGRWRVLADRRLHRHPHRASATQSRSARRPGWRGDAALGTRIDFPLLAGLSEAERSRLLAAGQPRRFRRHEVLCHQGDPGDSLHLILSGRLAVQVSTPLGDVATLSLLGAGESFGELALLDPDSRRTATVVALEPTRTLALRRSVLFGLREQHPSIDWFLITTMAGSVRRLSVMVLDAMYLPVEQRVRRRLVELARIYGGDEHRAEIHLTQDDVAHLAGTTRATANRVLRALQARGVLTLARGRITIADRDQLESSTWSARRQAGPCQRTRTERVR